MLAFTLDHKNVGSLIPVNVLVSVFQASYVSLQRRVCVCLNIYNILLICSHLFSSRIINVSHTTALKN